MVRSHPLHRTGFAVVGSIAVAMVIGLAGCGSRDRQAVPPTTSALPPPVTTPATVPSVDTPLGARLAIGTAQGMEIWSAATGVFTVGPALRDVRVSDIAWSPDGRALSWQTVTGSRSAGAELWWADVATGATVHWGPQASGRSYGPVVVTDAGLFTLGARVTRYAARPGSVGAAVAVPAAGPVRGSAVQAWEGGWTVEPGGSPAGQRIERFAPDGAALTPAVVLDAGTSHGPHFDLEAVDRSGGTLAAELATHGTGCEVSGNAQLWTVTLTTGSVRYSTPPAPGSGRTQRFWHIDVSGSGPSVYVSAIECATRGRRRGQVVATNLWRHSARGWHRVGADLVAADRAVRGPLATIRGEVHIEHGVAEVTGTGTVDVAGRAVAIGGQVLAWDPVRDIPSTGPVHLPGRHSKAVVEPSG